MKREIILMEPERSPVRGELAAHQPEQEALTLAVPSRQTGNLIAALAPAFARGLQLYCLDGGNVFDPLPLAAQLRSIGVNAAPILASRIFVSRAFTCHQLAGSVTDLLAPLAHRAQPPLAMILGIERMFLDEDIPLFERKHLFGRILSEACALRRAGLPLLITCHADRDNPWAKTLEHETRVISDARGAADLMRRISDGTNTADLQCMA